MTVALGHAAADQGYRHTSIIIPCISLVIRTEFEFKLLA